jgi:hypothetical protein
MKNIKHINLKTGFEKKVLSAIQHLYAYVKHRLYIGESLGILPKNMYTSNGIIDEGILKLYERGFNQDASTMFIKLELFKIIDKDLDALFKKESFHKNTMSTSTILKEELDDLEESFTVDEDFDYIMLDELNDISYKQDRTHKHIFLYDDNGSEILNAFDVEDISNINKKKTLGKMYSSLPIKVTDIVDLYVFGKLNFEEISKVKQLEIDLVEKIFNDVNKQFMKTLD